MRPRLLKLSHTTHRIFYSCGAVGTHRGQMLSVRAVRRVAFVFSPSGPPEVRLCLASSARFAISFCSFACSFCCCFCNFACSLSCSFWSLACCFDVCWNCFCTVEPAVSAKIAPDGPGKSFVTASGLALARDWRLLPGCCVSAAQELARTSESCSGRERQSLKGWDEAFVSERGPA